MKLTTLEVERNSSIHFHWISLQKCLFSLFVFFSILRKKLSLPLIKCEYVCYFPCFLTEDTGLTSDPTAPGEEKKAEDGTTTTTS